LGNGQVQNRCDAIIFEVDQFENGDPSEPEDHLASVSGWAYIQDTTKRHESIYYIKKYYTIPKPKFEYFIPVDVTTSRGSHNLLNPDTNLTTHGSYYHTTHRHTQLKLNRISRASQLLEDDWVRKGRPWTTPRPPLKQRISPFGADAYEDPSKCDHEMNPDTPHVHIRTGHLRSSRDTYPITAADIDDVAFADSDTNDDHDDQKTLEIFSDASVIDGGRKGAGAWRVRGGSVSRGLRVYPVDRPLSSTRAELITALNCIIAVERAYKGKVRLFIDNKTVVDRLTGMDTTRKARFWGKDADLCCAAHNFLSHGTLKADYAFRWVESRVDTKTDKFGKSRVPNPDELQNIAVDKEAAKAYTIPEENHDSPTRHLTISHARSQTATVQIMGRPVTGPLNEAIATHIRMELYHQYQHSRDHHHWSKDMDHTLRYNAHRAAPFKSKYSRTHGYRTTTNYRLFNDKYTTLGVKARRAGESVDQPCPWCPGETENTNHIITRCTQPTVVIARRSFLEKQRHAIATSKLTMATCKALTALYSIQNDGTMVTLEYPSEHETKKVVDKIIEKCGPSQQPLHGFYCRLWEMDAADRALSWIRRDWIFELTKISGNTVEAAEKLAIKLIQNSSLAHDMWRARCTAIRDLPEGDPIERRQATIQYETELRRTRRQTMPVPLELFLKKTGIRDRVFYKVGLTSPQLRRLPSETG
jgi:ribonuclease HI